MTIETEQQLDEILTRPRQILVDFMQGVEGPLVVLGGSGKMGPTLAVLARRAAPDLEVIAVSRFSEAGARAWLEDRGVRTIRCDLLDRDEVMELPEAKNIIYMAGRKFGTSDDPSLTWSMNTLPPAYVVERYPVARIVALSTGCVYPLVSIDGSGSQEGDELTPVGEYSNACVARERTFEYLSRRYGTPIALIRLNYAIDLRYGVLVDIASKVYCDQPVDVTMGYLNCIWQGDANEMILRSLDLATVPPRAINLTRREILPVRLLAVRFGELMGKEVKIVGKESEQALLSEPSTAYDLLGEPPTDLDDMMRWTAHWIMRGGRVLGKPTHYEVSDGKY
jgi:nucleoside-diphosphate-sugar epimerase